MTYEKQSLPARQIDHSEQIDLLDVLSQVWHGKWIVALFILFAVIVAGVYVSIAKERWTSTAVISAPDAGQIAGYSNAMSVIINDPEFDITDIQQRVIVRFNSAFSALSEALKNQQKPEELTIGTAVQGQPLPLKLTYVGVSAADAQRKLAEYIEKVDKQIGKELVDDLSSNIRSQTTNLVNSLSTQEKVAQEQKNLRIKQIIQALSVAKESGVKSPQVQQTENVSQDTMFLLGSTALESMVKNESSRPLIFSDDYYKTRQNLLDIQSIVVKPQNIHAYRYVMKPTLPIRRDSPRKVITLVLAILLGGILGTGFVLMRNAFRNYQSKA